MGQTVDVITNQEYAPGAYQIKSDISNLTAGSYICTFSTSDYTTSAKLLVVKWSGQQAITVEWQRGLFNLELGKMNLELGNNMLVLYYFFVCWPIDVKKHEREKYYPGEMF